MYSNKSGATHLSTKTSGFSGPHGARHRKETGQEAKMTSLLKDEVYDELEKIANGLSGVETALQLIKRDEKLQRFLRQYAKKNGIYTGHGYCYVGSRPTDGSADRAIHIWNNGSWDKEIGTWNSEIYIGPHSEREISPIFLSHYNGDGCGPYATPEIVEKEDGFYVEDPNHGNKIYGKYASVYHRQRITRVQSLVGVSTKVILDGLEKAIVKIMENQD